MLGCCARRSKASEVRTGKLASRPSSSIVSLRSLGIGHGDLTDVVTSMELSKARYLAKASRKAATWNPVAVPTSA